MAERRDVLSARVIYSLILLNLQHRYNKSSVLGPLLNLLNAINQDHTYGLTIMQPMNVGMERLVLGGPGIEYIYRD
jgi:hypothetical protein